jgi:hypothetical protein
MVRSSWTDEELSKLIDEVSHEGRKMLTETVKGNGTWRPKGSPSLTNALQSLTNHTHTLGKFKILFNDGTVNEPRFRIHNDKVLSQLKELLMVR